jgi:hypothetical protein
VYIILVYRKVLRTALGARVSKKEPYLVTIPDMNYLIFHGTGHPEGPDLLKGKSSRMLTDWML